MDQQNFPNPAENERIQDTPAEPMHEATPVQNAEGAPFAGNAPAANTGDFYVSSTIPVPPQAPPAGGYVPPYAPQATENAPKKKKKHTGLIVGLCIALFVVGIVSGLFFSGIVNYFQNENPFDFSIDSLFPNAEDEDDVPEDEGTSVDQNQSHEGGTFAPIYGDEEETLSPADVYAQSVHGVVGISTEITEQNIFGQQPVYAVSGTGFIFSEDGYILTNCHIVEDASTITVTMYDGTELEATLIGKDSQNDVAVVKIDTDKELTVLPMGKSADMFVGEEILVIGNPLGELTYTLTRGIVSNLSREIYVEENSMPIRMFQTDAAINNGNSGGPALDCHGNVIGIVSAKYASSSIEGLGFCIPIDDALSIAEDLIEHGHVKGRPYLGIEGQAVSGYSGTEYIEGVQITAVQTDSAADKAGLRRGDIITKIADKETPTANDLKAALSKYKAGDEVTLTVYRNRENVLVTLRLDEAE